MREHTGSNAGLAERGALNVPIEIEIRGRWDALRLAEVLIPYHSYLVHHEGQRWVVHARAPGCHGESLDDALRMIEDWLVERELGSSWCRVRGRPYRLGVRERT